MCRSPFLGFRGVSLPSFHGCLFAVHSPLLGGVPLHKCSPAVLLFTPSIICPSSIICGISSFMSCLVCIIRCSPSALLAVAFHVPQSVLVNVRIGESLILSSIIILPCTISAAVLTHLFLYLSCLFGGLVFRPTFKEIPVISTLASFHPFLLLFCIALPSLPLLLRDPWLP